MSDVPRLAVFCSGSIECIPGTASNVVFKLFIALPVASVVTGMSIHFMSHIRFISIHKLLYFSLLVASFYVIFMSAGIATFISVQGFSSFVCLFVFIVNYYIWPICCNFSVCVYLSSP